MCTSTRRALVLVAASFVVACGDAPGTTSPSASSTAPFEEPTIIPRFRWVELDQNDPHLDARVAEHADAARRELGLTPVVHMRTLWNTGGTLHDHKDDPAVQRALEGLYLIEIVFASADDCGPTCMNEWASLDALCFTYAQALHSVDAWGRPAAPSGSPGKFGPVTAEENASMLGDFRAALEGGSTERCIGLLGGHH